MNSMHNSFGGSGGYPGPYPGYVPPPTALPYYNGYPGDLTQVSSPYYGKPAAVPPGYSSGMGSYSAPPINNSSMYYQQYGLGYQYGYTKYGLGSGLGSSLGSNLGYSSELAGASGITPPSLGGLQAPTTDLGLTGSMFSKGKYNGGQGSPSPLTAAGLGVGHGGSSLLSPVTSTPPSPGPHNIPSGLAATGATPSPPVDIIESKKDLDKMRRCQVCGQVFRLMSECLAHMKSVHAVHEGPLSVYSLQHGSGSHLAQSLASSTASGVPSALTSSLGPPNNTRAGGVGAPDSPLMALERMGWGEKQSLLPSLHASPSPLTPAYTPAPAVTPGPQHPSTQHLSSQHMSNQHPSGQQHHPQHHSSQHTAQHSSNHHPASQTPPAPHPLMETSQEHHTARTPVSSLSMTYSMRTDTQVSQAHSRHAYSSPTCSVSENIPVSDSRTEVGVSSNYTKPRKTSSYSVSSIIGETKERVIERESNVAHEISNSLTGQSPTRRQVSPAGRSSMSDGFEHRISQLKQPIENPLCSRSTSRTSADDYNIQEREAQTQKEQVVPDQHLNQVDVHKGLQLSHGTPDNQKEEQKTLPDERKDIPEDLSCHVPSSPTSIHGTHPSLHRVPSREATHTQDEMIYEKSEKKMHLNSRIEDNNDSSQVNSPLQKEDDRTNSSVLNQQPSPQESTKESLSMEKTAAVLKEQVSQIGKQSWSPAQSHFVQHQLPQQQTNYQQNNQQQPVSAAHQVTQPKLQQTQQSQHQQPQLPQQQSQLPHQQQQSQQAQQPQQPQQPQHLQGQQQQSQQVHHHQGPQSQQSTQQPPQSQHQAPQVQQAQQPAQLPPAQQTPQISQPQQQPQLSQAQQQSQLTRTQQPPQLQAQQTPQLPQAQQSQKQQTQSQQHHHPQQQRQSQQPGYSSWSSGVGSGYSGQGTQYPYGYSQGSNSQSPAGSQHPQSPMGAHKSSNYHPMPNNYASPYGASPGSGYPPDLASRGPPSQQGYPTAHWYAASAGRMDSKSGWNIWSSQGHQPTGFPQSYSPYPYPATNQQQQKSQLSQQQPQPQHSQTQKQSQPPQPQLTPTQQPSQSLQTQQMLQSQMIQSQTTQTQPQPIQPQNSQTQVLPTQIPQSRTPQPQPPQAKTPQPRTPQPQPHTPQPQQQQQQQQQQQPQVQPTLSQPTPPLQQQPLQQQPEPALQTQSQQQQVAPPTMPIPADPQGTEDEQEVQVSRQSEQDLEEVLQRDHVENEEEEQPGHYTPNEAEEHTEDSGLPKEKISAIDNRADYQNSAKETPRPPTNSLPKKHVYKIGPKSKTLAAKQYSQIDDLDDYKCTITVHENGSVNGYGVLPTHPSAVKSNNQSYDSSDSEINSEDGSPTFVQLRPAKRRRKSQSREGIFIGPKRVKQARLVRERQERRHRHLQEQLRQTELEEQIQAIRAEKYSEEDGPLGNMLVKSSIILADSQMEEQDNVEQCIATIKAQQLTFNSSESGTEPDNGDKLSASPGQSVGKKTKKSHTSKVFHNENSVIIKTLPRPMSTRKLRAKDFKWSHYIKSMRYWCSDCAHGFRNQKEVGMHSEDRCKRNCLYMLECYVIVKDVQAHPQYGPKVQELLEEYQVDGNHKCKTCGEIIARKADFLVHVDTHKDFMPWECTICGSRFKIRGSLKEHLRYTHMKGRVPCLKCNKVFPTSTLLRQHVKVIHSHSIKEPSQKLGLAKVHTQHYKYKTTKNRDEELKAAMEATAGALDTSAEVVEEEAEKLSDEANEYRNWCKLMEINAMKNIGASTTNTPPEEKKKAGSS